MKIYDNTVPGVHTALAPATQSPGAPVRPGASPGDLGSRNDKFKSNIKSMSVIRVLSELVRAISTESTSE